MSVWRTFCLALTTTLTIAPSTFAVTVALDRMELLPPAEPVNVLEVRVSGGFLVGSDTEKPELSGWADVDLELDMSTGDPVLTGFSFRDGAISLSDVAFSLAFGSITAATSGMGGVPSTPLPPGVVIDGNMDAEEHRFTINQGTLVAAGETTDFAMEPLEAAGDGMGLVTLTESWPASGDTRHFDIHVELPVAAHQVLTIENVPVIGTTDVEVDVAGRIVAQDSFDLTIPNGDFNLDGSSDCGDLALLYDRVVSGNDHATYDVDGDGTVTRLDANAWVAARSLSAGDANLDGAVDQADFAIWQTDQFTDGGEWCRGDFNADGFVDGSDFNQWNDNQSIAVLSTTVPEPGATVLWLLAAAGLVCRTGVKWPAD